MCPKQIWTPCWAGRTRHDPSDRRGLREDGFTVPMTKLCHWFYVPRRTVYYKPVKANPKVQFTGPICCADQTDD
jgi:putative transposase